MSTTNLSAADWFALAMGLAGGLALFLFGLDQLSEGLKLAAGDSLKTLLTRLTTNRFLGALTGAMVTGILNSSSVTTVLVVGFVTAGTMTLSQSVAVIMGANVGSTVTAQLLAFNLAAYALLPVAVGFFMLFAGKRAALRYWGMMLMGLGLVFYGMGLMSDAMRPLRTYPPFIDALATMERPLYGIVAGALFTGLVQSSAATVGIAIALASEGLMSLPAGIALALGANIGTCATALLAALGKPVEAVRAATVHVLFNVAGVLLWLPLIGLLAKLAIAVSPAAPGLDGAARLAAEVPRQIANANTLFNILNTAFFIGFTGWFARLAVRLVPGRKQEASVVRPQFLDPSALDVPSVALEQVRQELGRVGEVIVAMLDRLQSVAASGDPAARSSLVTQRNEVVALDDAVLEFLARIRQGMLTKAESGAHLALMTAAVHLRAMADTLADDLLPLAEAFAKQPERVAQAQRALGRELYDAVRRAVGLMIAAVRQQDGAAAREVDAMSAEVRRLSDEMLARLAQGWSGGDAETLEVLRMQTRFVDGARHVFTLTKRIARAVDQHTLALLP